MSSTQVSHAATLLDADLEKWRNRPLGEYIYLFLDAYYEQARVAAQVAGKALEEGLPAGVLLNVNVPALKDDEFKGFMVTRQGLRLYHDALDSRKDPRGHPYYWIGGDYPTGVVEEGTDFGALAAGYVSITPLQLDMTAYKALEKLKAWNL